jgi:hypothetical protein
MGDKMTRSEAAERLKRELIEYENGVAAACTRTPNENEFSALVSFAYNCGTGALAKSTILKRLNAGDYEGAAAAFAMWDKARVNGKMTVLRGLTRPFDHAVNAAKLISRFGYHVFGGSCGFVHCALGASRSRRSFADSVISGFFISHTRSPLLGRPLVGMQKAR